MKINKNKQYVTREGVPIKIYEVYPGKGIESVHGAIKVSDRWICTSWNIDGSYINAKKTSFNDLVEIN